MPSASLRAFVVAALVVLAAPVQAIAQSSTDAQANQPQIAGDAGSNTTARFPTNKQNEPTVALAPDGAHAIAGVLRQILLRLRAAFAGHHVQPVEARGDFILGRGIRQQVAGKLLNRELVEGFVFIERIDEVIAVRENIFVLIAVITNGVRESHDIQPRHGHALAKMRRGEQPIHLPLVGVGPLVIDESFDFFNGGRRADEVETDPAQQGGAIGFGRWLDVFRFEHAQDKRIDGIMRPLLVPGLRHGKAFGFNVGPMRLVFRAGGDPPFQQIFLRSGQHLVRFGRRHDFVGISREDMLHELAGLGLAGNDGFPLEGDIAIIEAQLGFALIFVVPMADETVFGEDRPDVPIEFDAVGRRLGAQICGCKQKQVNREPCRQTIE